MLLDSQKKVVGLLLALGACDMDTGAELPPLAEAPLPEAPPVAFSATVDFGGGAEEVSYVVDEAGMALLGDMVLGPAELVASGRLAFADATTTHIPDNASFSGISHLNSWPGGVVPFQIDGNAFPVGNAVRTRIDNAIATWNSRSIVRLVPRDPNNALQHFVTFTGPTTSMSATEGNSAIGFQPGTTQRIRLGASVAQRTVEHEIGHAVGLFHEQNRTDRDNHVSVNFANVLPGKEGNFITFIVNGVVGLNFGPYDKSSVMHYGSFTFAADPAIPTLVDADCALTDTSAGCTFSGGTTLTTGDIAGVTRLVSGDPLVKVKLRNNATNQCLRPENGSRAHLARVVLTNCTESTSKRWYEFTRPNTSRPMLINEHSRLCLARDSQNRLVQAECNGGSTQRVTFLSAGLFSPGELLQSGDRCVTRVAGEAQPIWSTNCQDSASRRWHKDVF